MVGFGCKYPNMLERSFCEFQYSLSNICFYGKILFEEKRQDAKEGTRRAAFFLRCG